MVLGPLRHLGTLFLEGPVDLVPPPLESFLQPWVQRGNGSRIARRPRSNKVGTSLGAPLTVTPKALTLLRYWTLKK